MTPPVRDASSRRPASPGLVVAVAVCLLVPFVALLWVSSYAKASPHLWGIPFFYWYQLMWVFITAALTYVAYLLVERHRGGRGGTGFDGERGPTPPAAGPVDAPKDEEVVS